MKLNNNQKTFLKNLALISGVEIDKVKAVFNKLVILIMLAYMDGNPVDLPHIGELHIEYTGDVMTSAGKETKVKMEITPDAFLARQVGLYIDNEKLEIFDMIGKDIDSKLINIIED